MPVTAKLSRRVYEKLGDDVANAIVDWFNAVDATYKADLRELNDLNYARFDAKVGERFAQFEANVAERFAKFETSVAERFAKFEAIVAERFAQVDTRFERLEARIENCVDRATFEQRLSGLEIRLTRKIYAASIATFLAQTAAIIALMRFMVAR